MSELGNLLKRGQSRHEGLLGSPVFTLAGTDYDCVPSNLMRGTMVAIGGYDLEIALTLVVREEEIEGVSILNGQTTITHGGNTYKVIRQRRPAGGATREIDLIDPNA